MFAVVGNMLFIYELPQFASELNAVLTIIDAQLGNITPLIFDIVR